jgi:integrase/recombinase XerD
MDGKVVVLPKRKERLTLREAYQDFRMDREGKGVSAETLATYDQRIPPFLAFMEGRGIEDLAEVSAQNVKDYITELRTRSRTVAIVKDGKIERRTTGKRLRPWTLRSQFLSLSAFFNYHLKWERIDADPTAAFSVGDEFAVPKTKMYEKFCPSARQVQAILDLFSKPAGPGPMADFRCVRNRTIVLLMASKALRRSDILHARIENLHIDGEKPTLRTWRKGQRSNEEPHILALQPAHVAALRTYLKARAGLLDSKRREELIDTGPLFMTDNGDAFSKTAMRRLFATIRSATGIPVTAHTMRHFAISKLLLTPGVTPRQVQEIAGHSDLKTTLGYSHLDLDAVREAEAKADLAGQLLRR